MISSMNVVIDSSDTDVIKNISSTETTNARLIELLSGNPEVSSFRDNTYTMDLISPTDLLEPVSVFVSSHT